MWDSSERDVRATCARHLLEALRRIFFLPMVVDNVYIVECEYGVLVCGFCNVQWITMDRGVGSCCYVAVGVSVWYFWAHVSVSCCFVIKSNGIYFATIIGEDTLLVRMCTNNA